MIVVVVERPFMAAKSLNLSRSSLPQAARSKAKRMRHEPGAYQCKLCSVWTCVSSTPV